MWYHQCLIKNRLYQANQEILSYGTYEIDTLTEIIDTVMNLNNGGTTVEKKNLRRALYNENGESQTSCI